MANSQSRASQRPNNITRLSVNKTYKLFINGAFPRSESGRVYPCCGVNVPLASRKDVRDAVTAARTAQGPWSGRSAYSRGQILYRVAEMLEGRRAQFISELAFCDDTVIPVEDQVDASIDRWLWYAGWADKFAQVSSGSNPVAGPYFNLSVPEPAGVVSIFAPNQPSLLGLVSRVAPAVVSGNTVVVLASEVAPLPALLLAEVLATSDLPAGVVNILSGRQHELVEWMTSHRDVNVVDLVGITEPDLVAKGRMLAADAVTQVVSHKPQGNDWLGGTSQGLNLILASTETKTVWHPKGR